MTTPSDHDDESTRSGAPLTPDDPKVDLGKQQEPAEEPFDPYRFGRPDHPVPPEYAPPGYVPDPPVATPPPGYGTGAPYPYGAPPYGPPPAQPPYGQPPYGQPQQQPPYGQYPAPPYGQYPPAPYGQYPPAPGGAFVKQGSNGKATTALVLGILSVVLCWLSFLDAALIIPAVVFGFLGLAEAKARNGVGRTMAIIGLICATVGALLAITMSVLVVRAYDRCGGASQADEPGFNQCVQDNFFSEREPR